MNIKKPCYYDDFCCSAGNCPNSCCIGWRVDVDEDTCAKYKALDTPFGCKLHKSAEDKVMEFKDGACAFFNEDHLCEIQLNLGEDMLCKVCNSFPRFYDQYGLDREYMLSLACPEVARMVLVDEDKGEILVSKKDIELNEYSEFNTKLYPHFLVARDYMLEIVKDESLTLLQRMNKLHKFACDLVPYMQVNYDHIEDVVKRYKKVDSVEVDSADIVETIGNIESVLDAFDGLGYLDKKITNILDNAHMFYKNISDTLNKNMSRFKKDNIKRAMGFNSYNYTIHKLKDILLDDSLDECYQNLLTYYIYKNVISSVYDYEVLEKVKFCIVSIQVVKWILAYYEIMGEDITLDAIIDITHRLSRGVEHNVDNLKNLYKHIRKKPIFKKYFARLISEVNDG